MLNKKKPPMSRCVRNTVCIIGIFFSISRCELLALVFMYLILLKSHAVYVQQGKNKRTYEL